jgi:hypothetical protein
LAASSQRVDVRVERAHDCGEHLPAAELREQVLEICAPTLMPAAAGAGAEWFNRRQLAHLGKLQASPLYECAFCPSPRERRVWMRLGVCGGLP